MFIYGEKMSNYIKILSYIGILIVVTMFTPHSNIVYAEDLNKTKTYTVFKGDIPVLEIIDRPGKLMSTALPLPRASATKHSFLSVNALSPQDEDKLSKILQESVNTADFIKKLRQSGYIVKDDNKPISPKTLSK